MKVEFDQMIVIALIYKWNRQVYQEKQDLIKNLNLVPTRYEAKSITCKQCQSPSDLSSLACGHTRCDSCWRLLLQPASKLLHQCPECELIVPHSFVLQNLADSRGYWEALLTDFCQQFGETFACSGLGCAFRFWSSQPNTRVVKCKC